MNKLPLSRPLIVLFVSGVALLAGCQTTNVKKAFPDTPEPWRSDFQQTLAKEPDSKFSLACHGDLAALHEYFALAVVPLDGMRAQSFNITVLALYQHLGRRRFLAALSHESPEIRTAMIPHVPNYP